MESSTLLMSQLTGEWGTIKWLLVTLIFLWLASATVLVMLVIKAKRWLIHIDAVQKRKLFREQADEFLEQNKLDQLQKISEQRVESYPNDTWCHWYLALAFYHKGRWHDAKRTFQTILQLNPSWRETVNPYVEDLMNKISNSRPGLVK
ncbi:hypothetical protein H0A36_03935 [Endozoicomonas sp. SM1973]|uniref:Tetratricopeptide repeat protein n=1 Tax=Spartinivicinus marinus TaxID=2994442 RepID=A0A853ICP2_9GAMM|nr:hypothetical protein [Spartinivicinus marinus]MCX4029571.1 hypothetical protein [Spartinivicinus marinus]NYZ65146.1 hypothetical protein [Spartinivicinus marinus]